MCCKFASYNKLLVNSFNSVLKCEVTSFNVRISLLDSLLFKSIVLLKLYVLVSFNIFLNVLTFGTHSIQPICSVIHITE